MTNWSNSYDPLTMYCTSVLEIFYHLLNLVLNHVVETGTSFMFFNNMIFKFNTDIRIGTYLKTFPQECSFWYYCNCPFSSYCIVCGISVSFKIYLNHSCPAGPSCSNVGWFYSQVKSLSSWHDLGVPNEILYGEAPFRRCNR